MSGATARLTERQRGCQNLVGEGYTPKEIGRRLGIHHTTVDNHVRAALEILQVDNRAEAARLIRSGDGDQSLTSQPAAVVEPAAILASPSSAAGPPNPTASAAGGWVPPLGGRLHELSVSERLYAILRVAVAGIAGLVALTLVAAALLWLLS